MAIHTPYALLEKMGTTTYSDMHMYCDIMNKEKKPSSRAMVHLRPQ
jgi:hypothetical protein